MDEKVFKERTKMFALRIIHCVDSLPSTRTADVIGKQLLRCGTSVGANYRAACRAKSKADMISKLSIVEEELDESIYWMELLIESKILSEAHLNNLRKEGNELIAMITASIKTLRGAMQQIQNPKSKI